MPSLRNSTDPAGVVEGAPRTRSARLMRLHGVRCGSREPRIQRGPGLLSSCPSLFAARGAPVLALRPRTGKGSSASRRGIDLGLYRLPRPTSRAGSLGRPRGDARRSWTSESVTSALDTRTRTPLRLLSAGEREQIAGSLGPGCRGSFARTPAAEYLRSAFLEAAAYRDLMRIRRPDGGGRASRTS